MLNNTLSTNEVKDAAGAEVEFTRLSVADRETEFSKVGELPSYPHRLKIKHQETGSGIKLRRRSVIRIDKSSVSAVDSVSVVTTSAYIVLDAPIGALATTSEMSAVLANLMSFCASLGASTTILYDGTGNGAAALISGGL